MLNKLWPWFAWVGLTATMSVYLSSRLRGPDASVFLPGPTTHGHYQIELNCNVCHDPMMGVKEQSCYDCHGEDLRAANDAHPKSKFTDPRNADRVAALDARRCVTCHREHVPDQTRAMGLTLPEDYCALCHQDTVTIRPSHRGLAFNTCSTAGCHNFHDNTALYENFLERHLDEPDDKEDPRVMRREPLVSVSGTTRFRLLRSGALAAKAPPAALEDPQIEQDWLETAHAVAGVGCTDCHETTDETTGEKTWSNRLDHRACANCHDYELETFFQGKHGMRLAQDLSPMKPMMARLPMKASAAHRELNCTSCHGAHRFDTRQAAVESCLGCHDDTHTRAYEGSPHHRLWQNEVSGKSSEGTGVSCATCHMPRLKTKRAGGERVRVTHNQSFNFQPNEKMIRTVCLSCHGVGFAIDSLADRDLIEGSFEGSPSVHVESMDWVRRRVLKTGADNNNQLERTP